MQSKISRDVLFEYKLYIFSRNIYYKCSEIERSLSKIKFKEMLSLKVHKFTSFKSIPASLVHLHPRKPRGY